jgi:hypothetical protein
MASSFGDEFRCGNSIVAAELGGRHFFWLRRLSWVGPAPRRQYQDHDAADRREQAESRAAHDAGYA